MGKGLKMNRIVSWLLPVAISVAGVLGAGPASAAPKLNFVLPSPAAPYLLAYFVAQDLGWYKDAGLDVEEKVVLGDATALRAVISGDADLTYIGPGTILQAFNGGAPIQIVGSFQPLVDYRIVASRQFGADLKALADKRWATTGVGGMTETLPKLVMRKHGIDDSQAQRVSVSGGHAARYQAIAAGTVDATLLDTITTMKGLKDGKISLITSIKDDFPQMGYVYLTTRTSELSDPDKRKAIDIFIREGIRGARFIVDKPEEAAAILEKRMKTGDIGLVTDTLREINKLDVWGINGGLEPSIYDFTNKTLQDMKVTTVSTPYDKIVNTGPVDAALAALGKR
jgi:ABC-type nitrate/sulfonate/bicarbonate transport system substrate-binding protein